jgi:glycosyltransferase involved in cell wall biosynthesis
MNFDVKYKKQHWILYLNLVLHYLLIQVLCNLKIHYINNGVDLKDFEYNKEHFKIEDADLENDQRT